jgi:hypothetical protein
VRGFSWNDRIPGAEAGKRLESGLAGFGLGALGWMLHSLWECHTGKGGGQAGLDRAKDRLGLTNEDSILAV